MTVPSWMCSQCNQAVAKLGDTLCPLCQQEAVDNPDPHQRAIVDAKNLLDKAKLATNRGNVSADAQLAIAFALQGILVCQLALLRAAGADLSGLASPDLPGFVMLPNQEPEPERGPKPWGQ